MDFNIDKLRSTAYQPREADVPIVKSALANLFEGEAETDEEGKTKPPNWRVRGLSGPELARANEAAERNRKRNDIIRQLMSGDSNKIGEGLRELIGDGDTVPDDLVKRHEMLVLGSVDPEITHTDAVMIAERFPIEFYQLTNKISELTGMGHEPGKPKRSSGNKTSATASTSAT